MTVGALGHVTLMGAGPGDPDLLTVRAVRRLAHADVVFFDALSSPELRSLAPAARWFYVGKRAGRESIAQDTINRLLIREARRGSCVVRLKSGDPFVLGRGGEEALALVEAGVPFEIVPGVSSAIAAAGLAGIPVTHRGLATAFVVASGHAEGAWAPVVDGFPTTGATLVVLMGLASRGAITARLIARGFDPATPAALLLGAATPAEWRWTGRLDQLRDVALPAPSETDPSAARAPGVIVIGQVVALGAVLAQSQEFSHAPSERIHGGKSR